MGARLVGDDVGLEALLEQGGNHVGRVALKTDTERPALALGTGAASDGVIERVRDLVQVARLEPPLDAMGVDLDA